VYAKSGQSQDGVTAEALQALAVVPVDPDAGVEGEAVEEDAVARIPEGVR
jgi:hypothetical protein